MIPDAEESRTFWSDIWDFPLWHNEIMKLLREMKGELDVASGSSNQTSSSLNLSQIQHIHFCFWVICTNIVNTFLVFCPNPSINKSFNNYISFSLNPFTFVLCKIISLSCRVAQSVNPYLNCFSSGSWSAIATYAI